MTETTAIDELNTDLKATTDDPAAFLAMTWFLDGDTPSVRDYAAEHAGSDGSDLERAVRLFYAVRDGIRYDPYAAIMVRDYFRASHTLTRGRGFCVQKGVVLAAGLRSLGIPARLGYADVTNHLASPRLIELLGTSVFYWHNYVEVWLDGKWVSCTPVFNVELCEKFNTLPLDWDGKSDSLLHPFDGDGKQHMEYLRYHGAFSDLPYEILEACFVKEYAKAYESGGRFAEGGDFYAEAEAIGHSVR
ncbi:MAG TPA: transglutaminase-like domain-containing protein [Alphaproteobacteria bacterium]|nr:transglutaminase-like domain-containing protein [Alphaproteobacteria bacterium]